MHAISYTRLHMRVLESSKFHRGFTKSRRRWRVILVKNAAQKGRSAWPAPGTSNFPVISLMAPVVPWYNAINYAIKSLLSRRIGIPLILMVALPRDQRRFAAYRFRLKSAPRIIQISPFEQSYSSKKMVFGISWYFILLGSMRRWSFIVIEWILLVTITCYRLSVSIYFVS